MSLEKTSFGFPKFIFIWPETSFENDDQKQSQKRNASLLKRNAQLVENF
jgi:hypothetical protein